MNDFDRVKELFYNAITLIADETAEQYDDQNEWHEMVYNELGTTKEEMSKFGVVLD